MIAEDRVRSRLKKEKGRSTATIKSQILCGDLRNSKRILIISYNLLVIYVSTLMSSTSTPSTSNSKTCALCHSARAILRRPKTGQQICKQCFFDVFEVEVHNTITTAGLFKRGDKVAIGASGGKGEARFDITLELG